MANNHILTKDIGNLRGFSTANIFVRPPNYADLAVNLQRAPDTSLQIRRGYQCQIAEIGGLGTGTFDDPATDEIHTVTIDLNGLLYTKLTKQLFLYYDGQKSGTITGITNSNPAIVESVGHGIPTGTSVLIENVDGMFNVNNNTYVVTSIDANHFSLDGVNSTSYPLYTSGGEWIISFTQYRYLTFTIFTDPRYLVTNPGWSVSPWSTSPWGSPSGESITCNITVNRAAMIVGNQSLVNTMNVSFGHEFAAGDTAKFSDANGVAQQRNVTATTSTSITVDGYPVSVLNGGYVDQFFDIPFRKGFDVSSPYTISTFIATITDPVNGVFGLSVSVNGDTNYPAAFLQIVEPAIIDSNRVFAMDYWYWQVVNHTTPTTFPGSANIRYQNSPEFENASFAAFDDVIYIANGFDFPQKYDGQTVYRVGMPGGERPNATDNTTTTIKPFTTGNVYTYGITYEQIDNRGHLVEGAISLLRSYSVVAATAAINVIVTNILGNTGWNTNGAIATGGAATVYGADSNGFYYDTVGVINSPYTLKIGDSAFYTDLTAATINGNQVAVNTIAVQPGHVIEVGDMATFEDSTAVIRIREVTNITSSSITVSGDVVSVNTGTNISVNKVSIVYGHVAIVNGTQNSVNVIVVDAGHSILSGDTATFQDSSGLMQRRLVTAVSGTTVTIDGIPVNVLDNVLISTENQSSNSITLQRTNFAPATLAVNAPISNNLRILIYRTDQGGDLLRFLTELPNNSLGSGTQTFIDNITDDELGFDFPDPVRLPNPPPISKYLKVFGNQLLYGGGENNNAENSDNVFFSEGNQPENVPSATNYFSVPSVDDDVTGLGVSGTTLITTKGRSLWAITGDLLTSQFQVTQIAPGTNIGCVAHATIQSVGSLLYFLHTNGVYAITENQLFPTDKNGNPVPISTDIDAIFRETNFLPQTRYVLKRAVALNYTKDNQYLLFLPCEDIQSSIRTANANSIVLCYDYQGKNWFPWININAAGGMFVIDDDLYFQERRFSGVDGNTANLYKQHRFYRLVDHADHAGAQRVEWKSSWTDLGLPEVRKKFVRCLLLMDRISDLYQFNSPNMSFASYLDRIPNLKNTIAQVTTVDNIRNSSWSYSSWGWNYWSGYQDSFVRVNLKSGTVAKSIQIGFSMVGINMDIRFAGFQLEAVPENRRTIAR